LLLIPLAGVALRRSEQPGRDEGQLRISAALLAVIAAIGLMGWHSGAPTLQLHRPGLPVDASHALDVLGVEGALFNYYNEGGYLGWQHYGRLRVVTDGRSVTAYDPAELFAARRALDDPRPFAALDRAHRFAAALVPRNRPLCQALAENPTWQATWFGERRALFVRKDRTGGLAVDLQWFDPCSEDVDRNNILRCRKRKTGQLRRCENSIRCYD